MGEGMLSGAASTGLQTTGGPHTPIQAASGSLNTKYHSKEFTSMNDTGAMRYQLQKAREEYNNDEYAQKEQHVAIDLSNQLGQRQNNRFSVSSKNRIVGRKISKTRRTEKISQMNRLIA